jgi:hypothetical protein
MRLLSGCLAVLIATVVLFPVASRASCGSASCPIETLGVESREKGWLRLGYEFEYIDQDQPRIGTHDADVGEIRGHHDEVYTVNRTHRLTASYAFTDRLSADAILPFISRSHSHIHHHGGDDIPETWNFDGLGDASLMGRYVFLKPESASRPSLGILTGVELPTGKHEVKNEDGDLAEPGITPGSGSTDWIMGLTSNQSLPGRTLAGEYATLPLFFTVTYKANGRGEDNYRLGDVY